MGDGWGGFWVWVGGVEYGYAVHVLAGYMGPALGYCLCDYFK